MLRENVQVRMSEYGKLYDLVISKDHILRRIKDEIDFSFVNPMLRNSYCERYGRPATEPEVMFKILFLKKLYDLSDEALIESIKVNMAYKYFLDMSPEDGTIDSSLLTKFRKTRITEDILEEMLKETITQAITKGLIKSTAIIVDATHSLARYKHQTPTEILRKLTKELRMELYKTNYDLTENLPEKPVLTAELSEEIEYTGKLVETVRSGIAARGSEKAKELLRKATELLKDEKVRELQSLADEEAKTGHKSADDRFFGYKNHIAMTEERIITGINITDGAADDGKQLESLVRKSEANGITVEEIIGDAAYSHKRNLEFATENGIKLIAPLHPTISNEHEKERKGFTFNKDANTYSCPAGHLAMSCYKTNGKKEGNTVLTYNFSKVICKKCPLKNECKLSKKSGTLSVTLAKDIHKKQLEFQNSDYYKQRYRQRYKIEAKNSEAKQCHGLAKADSKGKAAMSLQAYFTAFVLNAKRILKLRELASN